MMRDTNKNFVPIFLKNRRQIESRREKVSRGGGAGVAVRRGCSARGAVVFGSVLLTEGCVFFWACVGWGRRRW